MWQIPVEEFQGRLAGQTSEFLLDIAYDEADLEEIDRIGPGGYFSVATHLSRLGAADRALDLYREAARREPAPWREWALIRAAQRLAREDAYREVVELLEAEESRLSVPELTYRYGEALYELDRYPRLLEFLEEVASVGRRGSPSGRGASGAGALEGQEAGVASFFDSEELSEERLVWLSVSRHQAGDRGGAVEAAEELFLQAPLTARQNRLLLYLDYYELIDDLDPAVYDVTRARLALLDGRYRAAAESFAGVAADLLTPELLFDAFRAFRSAGYQTVGSNWFLEVREEIDPQLQDRADYYAGVLLGALGEHQRATLVLRRGLAAQGDLPEYLLRQQFLRAAAASGQLPEAVEEVLARRQPGEELSGSLEESFYRLVVGNRRLSPEFARDLFDRGAAGRGAQVAVLASQGLLPQPSGGLEQLEAAMSQRSDLFYRFLAYAILPEERRIAPEELLLLNGSSEPLQGVTPVELPAPLTVPFYRRLLELGLFEEAYQIGLRYGSLFPPELLDEAGRGLQRVGRYYEALRVLHRSGYPNRLGSRERAQLFYPRPYDPLMIAAAEREEIDYAFWFSVVREESFFSSTVSSHVGAVGLSQLMPPTAADISSRMGLTAPDLLDPETNLAIGSRYLRMLLDRFDLELPALAAYNAGQGRVGRWIARNPRDMVRFHETIPFQETRNHVRKVLVSSVYYNYLYFDTPVEETVRRFFPSLREYRL